MLNELHDAIDDSNLQCLGVQRLVVVRAQGDAIIYTCLTIIRPEIYMMHFAPSGWPVTSWHSTPSVSGQDRSSNMSSKLTLFSSDGKHLSFASKCHRRNTDIAQQPENNFWRVVICINTLANLGLEPIEILVAKNFAEICSFWRWEAYYSRFSRLRLSRFRF